MKKGTAVLVTNCHRGIYYGRCDRWSEDKKVIHLKRARHCFYYSECEGTYSLATKGPQEGSKIGPEVNMIITDVATVTTCTDEAVKAWESAKWSK